MRTFIIAAAAAALAAAMTAGSAGAREDEGEHELPRSGDGGSISPLYAKECGACHVAYPPRLLPASSWRRILAGLERHFGDDAEVEPAVRAALERWLVERSGRNRDGGAGSSLRITDRAWFRDEHDEVSAAAIARPSIGSLANCGACHPGAGTWNFDEDRVTIPRR